MIENIKLWFFMCCRDVVYSLNPDIYEWVRQNPACHEHEPWFEEYLWFNPNESMRTKEGKMHSYSCGWGWDRDSYYREVTHVGDEKNMFYFPPRYGRADILVRQTLNLKMVELNIYWDALFHRMDEFDICLAKHNGQRDGFIRQSKSVDFQK